jgi:hypothetical protein
MNKKRLILIILILIIAGGIGIVIFLQVSKGPDTTVINRTDTGLNPSASPDGDNNTTSKDATPLPTRSKDELSAVISKRADYLTDPKTGSDNFGITKVVQPTKGWYIVTILVHGSPQLYKIILRDSGDKNAGLVVVAGPGTSFPPQDVSLPDVVRKQL